MIKFPKRRMGSQSVVLAEEWDWRDGFTPLPIALLCNIRFMSHKNNVLKSIWALKMQMSSLG